MAVLVGFIHIKRKGKQMGLSKEIQAGPAKIVLSEGDGVASLVVSVDHSVGGGEAAGVVKAKASIEIDLGAQQAADLGLALVAAHFPSLAPLIAGIKVEIDAVLGAK